MKIGWIGTGVMGAPMAGHLLDAGHALKVHTRTPARADALVASGALLAQTPQEAAEGTEVTFSMVGLPEDVEMVHLGDQGTLKASDPPPIIVDMTTSRPSLARCLAIKAKDLGVDMLDAPVSGGDVGARQGTLSIMAGGSVRAFELMRPLLEVLGSRIVRHGDAGSGQHCKMVNQILVGASMIGAVEALQYAAAAGLDGHHVLESVSAGAAGSWTIDHLAPRMLAGDFAPGFLVEHFVKDLRMALEEAEAMHLDLPGLAHAKQVYEHLSNAGHAQDGTHALALNYGQK